MNKILVVIALLILSASVSLAQTSQTNAGGSAANSTSARAGRAIQLDSGTQVAAQLQNTLDARRARVGDRVVLKTTQNIKQQGRTVVSKGARLIGHVTDVQRNSRSNGESRLSIVFDRLEHGNLEVPITATINSITQSRTQARHANDDVLESDTSSPSTASGGSSGSGGSGGLLGGVGNTVGGVLGSTTQAVGDTVSGTTSAVGSTVGGATRGVNRTLGSVQILQSGSASADGSSTLSLTGGNLRLESGTTFHLTLNQTAQTGQDERQ